MFQDYEQIKQFLSEYQKKYPKEAENVGKYIKILERGYQTGFEEKIIFSIFRAIVSSSIDPWDVDLKVFLRAYMRIVEESTDVDFFVASRIVLYSVLILYQKSENLVSIEENYATVTEETAEEEQERPILRIVRREKQRVTLVDILKVIEVVSEELKGTRKRRSKRRVSNNMDAVASYDIKDLEEHIHKEVEDLVRNLRNGLLKLGQNFLSFEGISKDLGIDLLSVFIALLFLIMEGFVELVEEKGNILIKVNTNGALRVQKASN